MHFICTKKQIISIEDDHQGSRLPLLVCVNAQQKQVPFSDDMPQPDFRTPLKVVFHSERERERFVDFDFVIRLFSTWKCFQKDNFHWLSQKESFKIKELAEKARPGKLTPSEFQGGTFSVSNWVCFQWTSFVPLKIHPSLAFLLLVGATRWLNQCLMMLESRNLLSLPK